MYTLISKHIHSYICKIGWLYSHLPSHHVYFVMETITLYPLLISSLKVSKVVTIRTPYEGLYKATYTFCGYNIAVMFRFVGITLLSCSDIHNIPTRFIYVAFSHHITDSAEQHLSVMLC